NQADRAREKPGRTRIAGIQATAGRIARATNSGERGGILKTCEFYASRWPTTTAAGYRTCQRSDPLFGKEQTPFRLSASRGCCTRCAPPPTKLTAPSRPRTGCPGDPPTEPLPVTVRGNASRDHGHVQC